jgi:hypothetical protein
MSHAEGLCHSKGGLKVYRIVQHIPFYVNKHYVPNTSMVKLVTFSLV